MDLARRQEQKDKICCNLGIEKESLSVDTESGGPVPKSKEEQKKQDSLSLSGKGESYANGQ